MNKKTIKIAGWALGLTLAVAGIGAAVTTAKKSSVGVSATGTAISASQLQSGDRCYIVAGTYVLKAGASFAAKKSGDQTETYSQEALGEGDAWLFTAVDSNSDGNTDYWNITTVVNTTTYYLYVTNDNNGVVCGTAAYAGTNGNWTIAATAAQETTSYLTASDGTNTRYLAGYSGTPNFRCYKDTSNGIPAIQLYKYSAPAKTVSSIAVTTSPKTTYEEGETLDLSGIVVTATWSDASTSNCTASATFSPANGAVLAAGDTTLTVTYGGKTTTLPLTVNPKTFKTDDLYLTATALDLDTSYASTDVSFDIDGKDFLFGRTDVMKNSTSSCIQLKASSGKFYNKSKFSAPISKVYFLADADNPNAPSNWAVYGSADTAAPASNPLTITTVDATNRVYSVDFTGGSYYFFSVAKTGAYATYFDMIVIELAHSDDDMAAVRTAANNMLSTFSDFCPAGKGPSASQWSTIGGYYTGLTANQKAIFDGAVLNTAAWNGSSSVAASAQGSNIQKAIQKIEYCVSTYGLTNFTSRLMEANRIGLPSLKSNETTMPLVVTIATLGAAVIAGFFLIQRKRKEF